LVKPGETLKIEKIKKPENGEIVFDKVLLIINGDNIKIGKPFMEDAKVSAKIIEEGRGKKVIVLKYKQKTRYHKKAGHRQPFTKITISDF